MRFYVPHHLADQKISKVTETQILIWKSFQGSINLKFLGYNATKLKGYKLKRSQNKKVQNLQPYKIVVIIRRSCGCPAMDNIKQIPDAFKKDL